MSCLEVVRQRVDEVVQSCPARMGRGKCKMVREGRRAGCWWCLVDVKARTYATKGYGHGTSTAIL